MEKRITMVPKRNPYTWRHAANIALAADYCRSLLRASFGNTVRGTDSIVSLHKIPPRLPAWNPVHHTCMSDDKAQVHTCKEETPSCTHLHGAEASSERCRERPVIRRGEPEPEELSSSVNFCPVLKRASIVKQCMIIAELEIAWFEQHPEMQPWIIE